MFHFLSSVVMLFLVSGRRKSLLLAFHAVQILIETFAQAREDQVQVDCDRGIELWAKQELDVFDIPELDALAEAFG